MKLVNFNISIKIHNSAEVVELLRSEDADIVTLQEVVTGKEEAVKGEFESKEAIDAALGDLYPYRSFCPLFSTNIQPNRDFGGLVEQGNYVLSKYPIAHSENIFFHREFEHINDWSNWENTDHGRAVQVVDIAAGKGIRILNVHGIWTADKRGDERTEKECEFIAGLAAKESKPTIIIGDLNLLPDATSLQVLNQKFRNLNTTFGVTCTRPTFKDHLEEGDTMVDYAFVNDQVEAKGLRTITTQISDHLPLVLEFE